MTHRQVSELMRERDRGSLSPRGGGKRANDLRLDGSLVSNTSLSTTSTRRRSQDGTSLPLGALLIETVGGLSFTRLDIRVGTRQITARPGQAVRIGIDGVNVMQPLVCNVYDLKGGSGGPPAPNPCTASFRTAAEYLRNPSLTMGETLHGLELRVRGENSEIQTPLLTKSPMAPSISADGTPGQSSEGKIVTLDQNLHKLLERVLRMEDSIHQTSHDLHTVQKQFESVLLNQERMAGLVAEHTQQLDYAVEKIKVMQEVQSALLISRTKKLLLTLYTPLIYFVKGLWVSAHLVMSTLMALSLIAMLTGSKGVAGKDGEGVKRSGGEDESEEGHRKNAPLGHSGESVRSKRSAFGSNEGGNLLSLLKSGTLSE